MHMAFITTLSQDGMVLLCAFHRFGNWDPRGPNDWHEVIQLAHGTRQFSLEDRSGPCPQSYVLSVMNEVSPERGVQIPGPPLTSCVHLKQMVKPFFFPTV